MTKPNLKDFEELTSLTALIDETPTKEARRKKEEEKPVLNLIQEWKKEESQGQVVKKQQTNKQPKAKKSYATPKETGESQAKIMTSIIIAEDVRDWLKLQSISSKQSMSQQIEALVRKEMKKA